jgi:hypothetical protein
MAISMSRGPNSFSLNYVVLTNAISITSRETYLLSCEFAPILKFCYAEAFRCLGIWHLDLGFVEENYSRGDV